MELLKKHIDEQLAFNRGKNLMHSSPEKFFSFIKNTLERIPALKDLDAQSEQELLHYLTEASHRRFCEVNQYYSFDKASLLALKRIYTQLLTELKRLEIDAKEEFAEIAARHYSLLKQWLIYTNPFATKLYSSQEMKLPFVPCSAYSPALQIQILGLKVENLTGPVLDIGCGTEAKLVNHLRSKNIEAYGIDRFASQGNFTEKADWLAYEYKPESWGTIISHLGFSNHFNHHHLRSDGNPMSYARKYIEILESLTVGGTFYYAPGLPFIEQYLDSSQFKLRTTEVGAAKFSSVAISRLK